MNVNVVTKPTTDVPVVACEFTIEEVTVICNALNNAQLTLVGANGMIQNCIVSDFIEDEVEAFGSIRDKLSTLAGLTSYFTRC